MKRTTAWIVSVLAGVLLGTVSNWIYDLLKEREFFPAQPTWSHRCWSVMKHRTLGRFVGRSGISAFSFGSLEPENQLRLGSLHALRGQAFVESLQVFGNHPADDP